MTSDSLLRVCLMQIAAGNTAWVTDLRDAALAKITAGGGQIAVLESASANGKSFTRRNLMDCVDVADITQQALDETAASADDEDLSGVASTGLDFSGLNTLD